MNPTPGPTAGSALDDASKIGHFSWDGVWFPSFEDYLVTTIAGRPKVQDERKSWHIIWNYGYAPVGACQLRIKSFDEVLYAYSASNRTLKLEGPRVAHVGVPVTLTVTDGETNKPVSGASVGGKRSRKDGHVLVEFSDKGLQSLKAEKTNVIRSKRLDILVV
ncbi:hypothetical protein H0H87_005958 [Tephrocybe sp. NHM501043]|nr:hypothetical protein H0H87_005958 [Tephrocybe sp. NHM501043]